MGEIWQNWTLNDQKLTQFDNNELEIDLIFWLNFVKSQLNRSILFNKWPKLSNFHQ